ncbi:MAG: site-2 protease family protein [Nitrospinota bacterium]
MPRGFPRAPRRPGSPLAFRPRRGFPVVNLVLFLITLVTTLLAGAVQAGVGSGSIWQNPGLLLSGLPFAGTLMGILICHEMGHYVMSRRWQVDATLPYFIPAPTYLGTFGAFIKIRSRIPHARALMDVAAAGPLAGLAAAIPAILVGLKLSSVQPASEAWGGLTLGSSLLFNFLVKLVHPVDLDAFTVSLHPVAFAGWIGLFVTALNLLPAGQLDGGHIVYALFRPFHRVPAYLSLLAVLGLVYFWPGWALWAVLIFAFGFRHPPVADEGVPLGRSRVAVGLACLAALVLTFTPVPFSF